jgi:hypothetical protein
MSIARAAKVLLNLSINDDVSSRVATSARHTELLELAKTTPEEQYYIR